MEESYIRITLTIGVKSILNILKRLIGDIHDLEIYAIEHEITLTKEHCEDKLKYVKFKTKEMPRFNNSLYFFMKGDLQIEYFIENPKPNQKEFALAYLQKFRVPTDFDIEFYNLNYSYYTTTGRYRWNSKKFESVKPQCKNSLAWLFEK